MYWLEFATIMMNFWRKKPRPVSLIIARCTKVQFASFQSGEFITARVVNQLERKLAKPTSGNFVETVYVKLAVSAKL